MKKYMILIFLLVLVAACLLGCGKGQQEDAAAPTVEDSVENSEHLTTDHIVAANETTSSLQYCDGKITSRFSLEEGDTWRWVDEPTFPLDGTKITEFLTELQALAELPEIPLAGDLSLYGLDDPQKYITLDSEAIEGSIYIGDQREDGTWYLMLENADHLHIIPDQFVQLLSRSVYDMAILPALPAFTAENLLSVEVVSGDARVAMTQTEGQWDSDNAQVVSRAAEVINSLGALQLSKCFDFLPSQQAVSFAGFSAPTAAITVNYLNSVNVEASFTLTLGALRSAEEGYYATINDDSTIYLIPSSQVSPLLVLLIYAK